MIVFISEIYHRKSAATGMKKVILDDKFRNIKRKPLKSRW